MNKKMREKVIAVEIGIEDIVTFPLVEHLGGILEIILKQVQKGTTPTEHDKHYIRRGEILLTQAIDDAERSLTRSMAGYNTGDAAAYEIIGVSLGYEESKKNCTTQQFLNEVRTLRENLHQVGCGKAENLADLICLFTNIQSAARVYHERYPHVGGPIVD